MLSRRIGRPMPAQMHHQEAASAEPPVATRGRRIDERGLSLVLALVFLLVASLLATSLLFISDTEFRTSKNYDDGFAVVNDLDNAVAEVAWRLNLKPGADPPPLGSTISVNDLVDFDASLRADPEARVGNDVDDDLDGMTDEPDEIEYNRDWIARITLTPDVVAASFPLVYVDADPAAAPWGGREVVPTIQPIESWKEYTSADPESAEVLTVRFRRLGDRVVFHDPNLVINGVDDFTTITGIGGDGNPNNDSPYNVTYVDGAGVVYPATGSPVILVNATARQRRGDRVVATQALQSELVYPLRGVMTKAICGCSDVDMGSMSLTDSYRSSEGSYRPGGPKYQNGDVGANGDIFGAGAVRGDYEAGGDITGAGSATGDATAGGSITGAPGRELYENVLPPPVPCECDALDVVALVEDARLHNRNATLPVPCRGPDIKLKGGTTCTLNCGTYYYNSLDIKGTGSIQVGDTSCGPVKIYVAGLMDIAGNGIVNTARPGQLQIFSSVVGDIVDIGGTADFVGVVYAPFANITLRGTSDVQGAVLGRDVRGNGGPKVHYDEDLGTLWQVPGSFYMAAWNEPVTD